MNTKPKSNSSLWRLQSLRVIQIIGFLMLAMGSAEFTGILAVMPPDWSKWLISAGPLLLASKPMLQVIGDWMDDGVKNDSFKFPMILIMSGILALVLALSLPLVGCKSMSSITITKVDGYLTVTKYMPDGTKYSYGSLLDRNGVTLIYRIEWKNKEGVLVRYSHNNLNGKSAYYYKTPDGLWVSWDSKSGVIIGDPPVPISS